MSTDQDWLLTRTCIACASDHVIACLGIAWDEDEGRIIPCTCGCRAANDTDVSNSPTNPVDANLASLRGKGEATDEEAREGNE